MSAPRLTRRGFGLATLAAPAMPALAAIPAMPVVAYHRGELYVDPTGRDRPYIAPAGARSAAPVEHLSEAELRELMGWPT
jgi:hypothetical protein